MFERFTERAREVVVQAQAEARAFKHDRIGTHHLLLGLLDVDQSLAAQVLAKFHVTDMKVEEVWDEKAEPQVVKPREEGDQRLPFTVAGQKMLELSLREALSLGHNYIGTEHILLAGVRVEGEAARILAALGVMPSELRDEVMRVLSGPTKRPEAITGAPLPLGSLLGERVRGEAHGGQKFEGTLVAIADRPQAIVRDDDGQDHHFTIETIRNLDVERREWVTTGR